MPPSPTQHRPTASGDERARDFPSGVPRRKRLIRPSRLRASQIMVLVGAAAAVAACFLIPPWSLAGSEVATRYHAVFVDTSWGISPVQDPSQAPDSFKTLVWKRSDRLGASYWTINHGILWLQFVVIVVAATLALAVASSDGRVRSRHVWAYSRAETAVRIATFALAAASVLFPPWQDVEPPHPIGYHSVLLDTSWAPVRRTDGTAAQHSSLLRIDVVDGVRRQMTICHRLLWPQLALIVALGVLGARQAGTWSYQRRRSRTTPTRRPNESPTAPRNLGG